MTNRLTFPFLTSFFLICHQSHLLYMALFFCVWMIINGFKHKRIDSISKTDLWFNVSYYRGLGRLQEYNRKYNRWNINDMFPRQDRNWSTIPWITNIMIITTASIPANNAPKNITFDDFKSHSDRSDLKWPQPAQQIWNLFLYAPKTQV